MMENYRICTPEKPFSGHGYELVIWSNGIKLYYLDSKRHRLDGPAIDGCDGLKGFYINGELYNNEVDFNLKVSELEKCSKTNQESMNDIKPDEEYRIVNDWSQLTKKGCELIITSNGKKWYYLDGLLHRENAPAVIYKDGYQEWFIYHKRHNLNGPARTWASGEKEYWIDHKEYTEKEWEIKSKEYTAKVVKNNQNSNNKEPVMPEIKEEYDGIYKVINSASNSYDINNLKGYNVIKYPDGNKSYHFNNTAHNAFGRAIPDISDLVAYWLDGKNFSKQNFDEEIHKRTKQNINTIVFDKLKDYCNSITTEVQNYYVLNGIPYTERQIEFIKNYYKFAKRHIHVEKCEYKTIDISNKENFTNKGYEKVTDNSSSFVTCSFRLNGNTHCLDGPAREWKNGSKEWFVNGVLHRLDGPAFQHIDTEYQYLIAGNIYNKTEYDEFARLAKIIDEVIIFENEDKNTGYAMNNMEYKDMISETQTGTQYIDAKYEGVYKVIHYTDNNAGYKLVIDSDGDKYYYLDGLLHNETGPAIIKKDGYKAWIINNELHRLDGPAQEMQDGTTCYWINDEQYEENEFNLKVAELNNKKSNEKLIQMQDKENIKPDEVKEASGFIKPDSEYNIVNNCDQLTGKGYELLIYLYGDKIYYLNGFFHKNNGPARIFANGEKEYWIYGKKYNEIEYKLAMMELNYVVPDSEYHIVDHHEGLTNKGLELVVEHDEDKIYYLDGFIHKDNGPAKIFSNGEKEYWIFGKKYGEDEFHLKMVELFVIKESITNNNSKELDLESLFAKGINPETIELYKDYYAEGTNHVNNPETIKPKTLTSMIKNDAQMALYRVATTQITKGIKNTLLQVLERQGSSSEHLKSISELLDSEFGSSLISMILGLALTYAPGLKDDKRVTVLAKEFRINGMAVAGNAVIGVAIENFLPVITNALKSIPEEPAAMIRIANHDEENNLASQELEKDDEAVMKNSL